MASSILLPSSFTTTSIPQNPKSFFRIPPTARKQLFSLRPISCTSSPDAVDATASYEPQGIGPAAPTRGELLIERHHTNLAASVVLNNIRKKKKKNRKTDAKVSVASCYGCGAPLQTGEVDAPGYVESSTYELKKKHRQLRTVLCGRCKLLSHGHMVTAVGGNGGYPGGRQFVSAEQLREKLAHLRNEKALIVKLVDIVDFNGSFLAHVRDLAGANPIMLVITKIDLLPKGTDLNCVGDWVVEASLKKKLNVISVHLTSSKSLVGIVGVISEIQKEKRAEMFIYWLVHSFLQKIDVQFQGAANVGKSAFINSMLRLMAERDPVAAAARRYKPIQSAVPGTTLGPIQIDAFQVGKLFDTPGVHLHHRQSAVVHSEDLPCLAPLSRIRGRSFPASSGGKLDSNTKCLNGLSIFWGGLFRIDIMKVLPWTRLTFYGPRALQIHAVPTVEADEFYHKELGNMLTPPVGKERAELWPGLQTVRDLKIQFDNQRRPACDISISGLGWISVEPVSDVDDATKIIDDRKDTCDELHFSVHIPKPVEIFIRPPLPVGQAGGEWYEYRDLTEKEEESRPKWFF